jgi:exodeoxyribonuclease VII large subunit
MTEKLSLTELQLIIRDSLYMAHPDMYWVIAEISEMKENQAGHCYLELIEKHPQENNVRSRAKAIIWSNRYRFIKSFFENITGESLREGLRILVKTKVEYHEIYGLSLLITDIDPAFTIGEMAMNRQEIIKRLVKEGVFSMNKEIELPSVPQRIAVISSKNAAGYTDFINQLNGNSFGYVFYTSLTESPMQGSETEAGIINALDKIAENLSSFDIVIIIRGGGSQSDLSWFDNYNIAYHVTQFPIPVITGIGHDKDLSVTDLVANMSLKTPTAVADFIIDIVAGAENHLMEMSSEITVAARQIIETNRLRIETSRMRLIPLSRVMIATKKDNLSSHIIEIINIGKEFIIRAGIAPATQESKLVSVIKSFISLKKERLAGNSHNLLNTTMNSLKSKRIEMENLHKTLIILNPENILERGYTITSKNGKIMKKSDQVFKDDIIDTFFSDGSVSSTVLEKEVKKN